MKLTERQWARLGLSLLAGLVSACLIAIVLYVPRLIGYEPTLALLSGIAIAAALYIYDARTDSGE